MNRNKSRFKKKKKRKRKNEDPNRTTNEDFKFKDLKMPFSLQNYFLMLTAL